MNVDRDSVQYGLEGFQNYIRNKIKYQRENLKFDDFQIEAAFYSDLKALCQEYYSDLFLNDELVIKHINDISNNTRDLVKKRQDAVKAKETQQPQGNERPKALSTK
jgi:hypothetical protein